MNDTAPSAPGQSRKGKSWVRTVEWASLIGGVIAVLGFLGYPSLSSLCSQCGAFDPAAWFKSFVVAPAKPEPRPPPLLPPARSLSGLSWTFVFAAQEIRLDFLDNGEARFSDPVFGGGGGHWTAIGKTGDGEVVKIDTPNRIVFATQEAGGDKMTAMIYRREGARAVLDQTVLMTRAR
jgi:hypothetical protein